MTPDESLKFSFPEEFYKPIKKGYMFCETCLSLYLKCAAVYLSKIDNLHEELNLLKEENGRQREEIALLKSKSSIYYVGGKE